MLGPATVSKLPSKPSGKPSSPAIITLTPERAAELLEHNSLNRPMSDLHMQRIAKQIVEGKWRFNGDTIKIADTGDVLDGQHRLWAIIEAKKPVETIIVYGISREAFATIDTLRKPRSGGDVIALAGQRRHRTVIAGALQWLLRWQRNVLEEYKAPQHRIENSDVEAAFEAHPAIVRAVERASSSRSIANPSVLGFVYYIAANRNEPLAERMMQTFEAPESAGINDPFFRLRAYFLSDHHKRKDPIISIALAIKALNAAAEGKKVQVLNWKNQGQKIEDFPALKI